MAWLFDAHKQLSWIIISIVARRREQYSQCTCNLTLGRVRATIVVVGKQWALHILSVCISSLCHPACNAHAPYHFINCGLSGCTIFFHIMPKRLYVKKSYWTQNVCFDFLYNFCPKHFSFWEEMTRYVQKCTYVYRSSCTVPLLFLSDFNETWILPTYFREKTLKYEISWKSVQWETSCFLMRTNRRTEMTKVTVAFRNSANAPIKNHTNDTCPKFLYSMSQQPPSGPGPANHQGFTITLTHTTLGRTPLNEWSARRRNLYLTKHNIHNREIFIFQAGFEPAILASERPQTHA